MIIGKNGTMLTDSGVRKTLDTSAEKSYNLCRLNARHHKILELVLAGHDSKAISQVVGMSQHGIALVCRAPLFQTELCRRRKESGDVTVATLDRASILGKARSVLEGAAERAAKKHIDLLEAENEGIQLKAADKILDRVFGKSGDERKTIIQIDTDQVNLLNLALKESYDVKDNEQTTNSEVTNSAEDRQSEELETSESRAIAS